MQLTPVFIFYFLFIIIIIIYPGIKQNIFCFGGNIIGQETLSQNRGELKSQKIYRRTLASFGV